MERDPARIMDILRRGSGKFDDEKAEYDKEVVPPDPVLFFDRAMENRHPRTSNARLFACPDEIITEILSYIDDSSSSELALVDRDCQQLARSSQFSSIVLDYSIESFQLLAKLVDEAMERENEDEGFTTQPSIGACIRRITISSNPRWFAKEHGIALLRSSAFDSLDEEEKMSRFRKASKRYYDVYLPIIEALLRCRIAFPNLQFLDWRDSALLSPNFFNCFHKSEVKHLKLYDISLSEDFELDPPDSSNPWPLQSLHLDIWRDYEGEQHDARFNTSLFCSSLLRQCAPSIETLVWYGHTGSGSLDVPDSQPFGADISSIPKFPELHKLHLYRDVRCDSSVFGALLNSPLTSLKIEYERGSELEQSLRKRGCIDTLKSFVWDFLPTNLDGHPSNRVLEFLRQNTQLSQFALRYGPYHVPNAVLERRVLPLLAKSFSALSSLSLDWREDIIPESALAIISTLKSLKQISLSAGHEPGSSEFTWYINHRVMQKHLAKLPGLEKVAFSRDIYLGPLFDGELEDWLADKYDPHSPPDFDPEYERRKEKWKVVHRWSMMTRAAEYMDILPNLEWIFVGRHQFHVEIISGDEASPGIRKVDFDTPFEKMDSCFSLLRRTFEEM
jgi:hypothetical protein